MNFDSEKLARLQEVILANAKANEKAIAKSKELNNKIRVMNNFLDKVKELKNLEGIEERIAKLESLGEFVSDKTLKEKEDLISTRDAVFAKYKIDNLRPETINAEFSRRQTILDNLLADKEENEKEMLSTKEVLMENVTYLKETNEKNSIAFAEKSKEYTDLKTKVDSLNEVINEHYEQSNDSENDLNVDYEALSKDEAKVKELEAIVNSNKQVDDVFNALINRINELKNAGVIDVAELDDNYTLGNILGNDDQNKDNKDDQNKDDVITMPDDTIVANTRKGWHPELTDEQILDALNKDIYEPVGIEYEQFLLEHGLTPIKDELVEDTIPNIIPNPVPVKEELEEKKLPAVISRQPVKEPIAKNRGYRRIISDLLQDVTINNGKKEVTIGVKKTDNSKYKFSNMKVAGSFVRKTHTGNLIYNIAGFAPGLISIIPNTVGKLLSTITYTKKDQFRINVIKERISKLSRKDIDTLINTFTERAKIAEKLPTILNTLICEKISEVLLNDVAEINECVEKKVIDLIHVKEDVDAINFKIANTELSEQQRLDLIILREKTLAGSRQKVLEIEKLLVKADHKLNGNGNHALAEANKARATKMNYRGRCFAKMYNLMSKEDKGLLAAQAGYEDVILNSMNDEEVLNAFIGQETVYIKETKDSFSLAGMRSTGRKAGEDHLRSREYDYNEDPLLKDVIRTAALVAGIASVTTGIANAKEAEMAVNDHNAELDAVNSANQQTIDFAKDNANQILNNQNVTDGVGSIQQTVAQLQGQIMHNTATRQENFGFSELDEAAHAAYTDLVTKSANSVNIVKDQLTNGSISNVEAINLMNNACRSAIYKASEYCKENMGFMQDYISKSRWDYTGDMATFNMLSNPVSLENMLKGIDDTMSNAEIIAQINATIAPAIGNMPNNIAEEMLAAIGVIAIISSSTERMKKNMKGNKYISSAAKAIEEYNKKRAEIEQLEPEDGVKEL